jgi:hypothetical protein
MQCRFRLDRIQGDRKGRPYILPINGWKTIAP